MVLSIKTEPVQDTVKREINRRKEESRGMTEESKMCLTVKCMMR